MITRILPIVGRRRKNISVKPLYRADPNIVFIPVSSRGMMIVVVVGKVIVYDQVKAS